MELTAFFWEDLPADLWALDEVLIGPQEWCWGRGWARGGDRVSSSGRCRIQSRSWVRGRSRSPGKVRERGRSK